MNKNVMIFTPALFLLILLLHPASLSGLNLQMLANRGLSNFELLDVEQKDGFLVVTAGLNGTTVVDVTDPSNPIQLSSYSANSCLYGRLYNTFIGSEVVAGAGRNCPLQILDLTDSYSLNLLSEHQSGEFSYEDMAIVGDSLIIAAAHGDGIEAIDISNVSYPTSLGNLALDNAWAVRVDGYYAYVADGGSGLTIVDFSDPTDLKIAGQLETEGSAKDVRVMNGYAFVALGDAGIAMIDVSDPTSPTLSTQYNTTGLAAHIGVNDSLVAVADWDDVEILKYGPGNNLELAGKKTTHGRVMGIDIADDIVYVAEWNRLRIYRFGPIQEADLDIEMVDIHFPRTDIGESVDTALVVTNSGGSTLTIESIDISFEDFSLDVTPPVDIPAGENLELTLTYTPSTDNGNKETITFASNDSDWPSTSIDVWGNDIDLRVGDPAPDFTLPVLEGGEVTLSELRGSIVVLSFFASW